MSQSLATLANKPIVAAFHAYGLDKEETGFVLDDPHRVQNPRVMEDAYFEMVKEKYVELRTTDEDRERPKERADGFWSSFLRGSRERSSR